MLKLVIAAALLSGASRSLGDATGPTGTQTPTTDPEILQMEEGFEKLSEDLTRFTKTHLYPIISEIVYDPRLSAQCAGSLLKVGAALRTKDIWVLQSKSLIFIM